MQRPGEVEQASRTGSGGRRNDGRGRLSLLCRSVFDDIDLGEVETCEV